MTKPVNTGTMKHLSPFRYPGGKTWLIPHMLEWIDRTGGPVDLFLEPFAGGASVGLAMLTNRRATRLHLIEMDPGVAAVWRVAISDDAHLLAQEIMRFDMNRTSAEWTLDSEPLTDVALAFQTIVRNRAQRGGVMSPDAGLMKNGDGKGVASRWYPETLAKRIMAIHDLAGWISISEGDGTWSAGGVMANDAVFIDPPYTASKTGAGRRLYTHHEVDHEAVFRTASKSMGRVAMTYDDCAEVADLIYRHDMRVSKIAMQTGHNRVANELFIEKRMP